MVIAPYTRPSWRLWGGFFFVLTAWWVYSWAWFSISGLLLADGVVNMDFKMKSRTGFKISSLTLPKWTLYVFLMAGGFTMMFIWAAARPDLIDAEIDYHTGIYNTGGVYTWNDVTAPQLRADDYLVIIGFYLLLDTYDWLQRCFGNPVFVYLGRRSFSEFTQSKAIVNRANRMITGYFLIQSIIIYTLGIKLYTHLSPTLGAGSTRAQGVSFIACLVTTVAAGEAYYWLIDRPSQILARITWKWMRE